MTGLPAANSLQTTTKGDTVARAGARHGVLGPRARQEEMNREVVLVAKVNISGQFPLLSVFYLFRPLLQDG
jgi:hypothetical protein